MLRSKIVLAAVAVAALSTAPALSQTAPDAPAGDAVNPFSAGAQPAADPLAGGASPASMAGASPGRNGYTAPVSGRAVDPRAARTLNLEQKAWENPNANKPARQISPGYVKISWRPDQIPQINIREGMLTIVKFPADEEIVQTTVSDPGSYETQIGYNRRSVTVRSLYAGIDGNLIVHGRSGNVYNFYVRSRPFNAQQIPDTTVEIVVGGMRETTGETVQSQAPLSQPYDNYKDVFAPSASKAVADFKAGGREFARSAKIANANMANNIEIKVRNSADQAIAPVRAWHDDHFTYLDFGPRASSMNSWPVASIVVQGVESPVGTRVQGRDRSLMVVEALGNIVLRNGQLQVCLKTIAPNNDPRYAIPPRVNDDPRPRRLVDKTEIVTLPAPAAAPAPVAQPAARSEPKPAPRAAPRVIRASLPETPAPRPATVSVVYSEMSAQTGDKLWASYRHHNPADAARLSPQWLSDNGQPPEAGRAARMQVSGVSAAQAERLCPPSLRSSADPDLPRCSINRPR